MEASRGYLTPDPLGLGGGTNLYVYVGNNPIGSIDPLGLAKMCCRLLNSLAGSTFGKKHCYIVADDGTRYGLYPEKDSWGNYRSSPFLPVKAERHNLHAPRPMPHPSPT